MKDAEKIQRLGGATRVARLMGIIDQPGSVQRIHNWKSRGIPAQVKLDYPDLFLRKDWNDLPELADREVEHG